MKFFDLLLHLLQILSIAMMLGIGLVFNQTKGQLLQGSLDLDSGGDDVRMILVMTNTTADTDPDPDTISGISTLDEMDGANYARATLTGESVTIDDASDVAYADCDDPTFSSLGNGTRAVQGAVFYKHVTNDTDSVPLTENDFSVSQNPGGSDFTVNINAEGYLKLT